MTQRGRHSTPAYRRIQGAILKRIEAGQLRVGDAVGSERALAKIHKVSLMTARHALASLERDGRVERRRGSGTFVAPPKIHFNKLMSFSEQLAGTGLSPRSKVLSLQIVDGEPEIAARLCLPSDAQLLKLERLRQGANEPFALETCYLPAADFSGLRRTPLERGSLFSILEREYRLRVTHADEEVDATATDARAAKLLSLEPGVPLLRIRQVIYAGGKPTIYVRGLYRSDRHTLLIRRFRNGM